MFETPHVTRTGAARTAALALLGTAFLWGCSDGPFEPAAVTGPGIELDKGGKSRGGGPSVTLTVEATGAVATPPSQVLDIWTDNTKKLAAGGLVRAAWNFAASQAAALADLDGTDDTPVGLDNCFIDAKRGATVPEARVRNALSKLVDVEQNRALNLSVDKTALDAASADHNIGGHWDGPEEEFDLGVGTIMKLGDPATVTLVSGDIDAGTSYIRYTGGSVNVKDRTESASFSVFCPNLDVIDVVVTR